MIARARAPMRIDLAGGWTDVPPYVARQGGAVVNVAISLYAHAFVRPQRDGVRLSALEHGAVVTARRADELRPDGELALLKAAARRYAPPGGFELVTRSDAPAGSGLGGSGALGVALVAALTAARGERRMPAELAQSAHQVEVHDAGVRGGKQDQYIAALGGVQYMEFGDPEVSSTRLEVPFACLKELEQHLVLCFTGSPRSSDATHGAVWERIERGDVEVLRALDGIKECAKRMRDALVLGDVGKVGELLAENWRHQQALAPGMQTETMRALEQAAATAGAEAAKACGAGAGGCLVFLARPGRDFAVAEALRAAGGTVLPFTFDGAGVVAWEAGER
ncbi:MAG: hypothetical protein Q8Q85_03120 [Gemmatimonadales bacterium]|nr:hypothetical protein [Gemmatimonadales bacterium]